MTQIPRRRYLQGCEAATGQLLLEAVNIYILRVSGREIMMFPKPLSRDVNMEMTQLGLIP